MIVLKAKQENREQLVRATKALYPVTRLLKERQISQSLVSITRNTCSIIITHLAELPVHWQGLRANVISYHVPIIITDLTDLTDIVIAYNAS